MTNNLKMTTDMLFERRKRCHIVAEEVIAFICALDSIYADLEDNMEGYYVEILNGRYIELKPNVQEMQELINTIIENLEQISVTYPPKNSDVSKLIK